MPSKIVPIDLGYHDYDIYIGDNLLYRIQDFLPMDVDDLNCFILTDENVEPYAQSVKAVLESNGAAQAHMLVLKAGEQTKSFEAYQYVCEWMLENKVERKSVVFAIGGGVIGDLTGFVAASVMRGVQYIQVPTSLLAQVDSSVGGKTGINTGQGKNLVGAFHHPSSVIADIETLKTLPARELLAGYAEVVKYGLIGDLSFYQWLEDNGRDLCQLDADALSYAIEVSAQAKAKYVVSDEREMGRRALLNLGHTFGHALEAAAGYDGRLLHGEAVAIGTVMAADLSSRMGLLKRAEADRIEEHFITVGLPTRASFISPALNITADDMLELMSHDKKVKNNKLNFVLLNTIGDAFISDEIDLDIVRDVIKDSLGENDAEKHEVVKGRWKQAFSSLSSQS